MVHSLRLFWFLMYGGYPTKHDQLGKGFQTKAKPNWAIYGMEKAKLPLSSAIFQSLLRNEFKIPTLADAVPLIGGMFETARELRNDSNYESLILAHQYFHQGNEVKRVHVPREMGRTANTMSKASQLVLQFAMQIIDYAFRNGQPWIGVGSPYSGADLKALLWGYVRDKILGVNDRQEPSTAVLAEWLQGLPDAAQDIKNAETGTNNPAKELIDSIRYGVFFGKQVIMEKFRDEAGKLERSVELLTTEGSSRP
jgi:hypothetical protein